MATTIHERISEIVLQLGGGKNTAIASKLGVSEGNIRGYIKGVMPKQDVLEKIVINLDVNPECKNTSVRIGSLYFFVLLCRLRF